MLSLKKETPSEDKEVIDERMENRVMPPQKNKNVSIRCCKRSQGGGGTYGGHVVSSRGLIEVEGKQIKCLQLDREGAGEAKSAAKKAGTSLYFAVGCGKRSKVRVEGM